METKGMERSKEQIGGALKMESSSKCFGGTQLVYSHYSDEVKGKMTFSIFLPPADPSNSDKKWPVLYWLSGLTCTEANFMQKSGFQKYAAEAGVVVVGPDTSPRGCKIEGDDDSYDFGSGAGFYVDATEPRWSNYYRMYSYVTKELPKLIAAYFPVDPSRQSVFGHSMGGHGALVCYLKNPGLFKSVSAFAPIANPMFSQWGIRAFSGYLGQDKETWKQYDATELVSKASVSKYSSNNIRIEQGGADDNLAQLLPDNFTKAAQNAGFNVDYQLREGYDHGYFFVATFIGEHIAYHMKFLQP